jgi:hypothetical protein
MEANPNQRVFPPYRPAENTVRVARLFRFLAGFLPFMAALFLGGALHGQTAAGMDDLLNTRAITWAQACRFVLPAAGELDADVSPEAAFEMAREKGWLPKGASAQSTLNLGGLSLLIVQSFSIKKSLLFALFPGPRYAYRQLEYLGLMPGLRDPALKVSGERFLSILSGVLDYRGDGEAMAEADI